MGRREEEAWGWQQPGRGWEEGGASGEGEREVAAARRGRGSTRPRGGVGGG